jgi:hypothetical protein
MTTDDQQMRRRRWAIGIEVAGLVTFMVALAGLVVVIVIGWPWPLIAVGCAVAMRVGVEGILRPSFGEVDEPS